MIALCELHLRYQNMGVEVKIVAGSYEQISFGYSVSRDGEVRV